MLFIVSILRLHFWHSTFLFVDLYLQILDFFLQSFNTVMVTLHRSFTSFAKATMSIKYFMILDSLTTGYTIDFQRVNNLRNIVLLVLRNFSCIWSANFAQQALSLIFLSKVNEIAFLSFIWLDSEVIIVKAPTFRTSNLCK